MNQQHIIQGHFMRVRFLLAASCFFLSPTSWANPRIKQPLIARDDSFLAAVLSPQTAAILTVQAVSGTPRLEKRASGQSESDVAVLVITNWSQRFGDHAGGPVEECSTFDPLVFFYHGSQVIAIGLKHPNGDVSWTHAIGRGPLGPCFLKDLTGQGADYFIFTDHLGTPFAWFDPDTGQTTYTPFNPWGELLATPTSGYTPYEHGNVPTSGFNLPTFEVFDVTPLGLAGHIYDEKTGLVYMHHRYLHPRLGHFLTPDFRAPDIYDPSTFTEPYAYAAGNPIMFWDPNGLQTTDFQADEIYAEIMGIHQEIAGHGISVANGFATFAEIAISFSPIDLPIQFGMALDGSAEARENLKWAVATIGVVATVKLGAKYGPDLFRWLKKGKYSGKLQDLIRGGRHIDDFHGTSVQRELIDETIDRAEESRRAARARLFYQGDPRGTVSVGGRLHHVVTGARIGSVEELFDVAQQYSSKSRDELRQLRTAMRNRIRTQASVVMEQHNASKPSFYTPERPGIAEATGIGLASGSRNFHGLYGRIPDAAKWIRSGGRVNYHPSGAMEYMKDGYSVTYSSAGFPDFTNYLYRGTGGLSQVRINLTGDRYLDELAANAAAGFESTPLGYTWHHNEDLGLMQLVMSDIHSLFWHTGGFSLGR